MATVARYAPLIVAMLVLLPAAYVDIRFRRIPNILSLGGFVLACIMHGVLYSWSEAGSAAIAGLILMAGFFPFFMIGWLGAGDVKLIAAVGAFCGTISVALLAIILIVVSGVLISLGVVAWRTGAKDFLLRFGIFSSLQESNSRSIKVDPTEEKSSGDIPYAAAIAVGGILVLVAQSSGLI